MNGYMEYIVEKKKSMGDVIKAALTVGFAFLLIWPLLIFYLPPLLTTLLVVGIVYGASKILGTVNIEFEYTITDSDLDVDKIINRKSRKRLGSINLRRAMELGESDGIHEKKYTENSEYRVIDARSDRGALASYLTFKSDEGKGILLFSPGERMEEYIKEAIKRNF